MLCYVHISEGQILFLPQVSGAFGDGFLVIEVCYFNAYGSGFCCVVNIVIER